MPNKFTQAILFGLLTLSALPMLPAQADTFRDSDLNIYITDVSPNAQVEVEYPAFQRSRDMKADACGFLVIKNSSTNPVTGTITVAGTSVNTNTLATQLLPKCTNGAPEEARNSNFKTSTGDVVIVGRQANSYSTVTLPATATRRATANACGFARLASSNTYQHASSTQIQVGSAPATTIGALTQKDAPFCRSGVLYVPASWLSGS